MRTLASLVTVAVAIVIMPIAAEAQNRLRTAAVGGIAGAVVAGPVGLFVGGVIGYAAGPEIACSIGVRRCYRRHRYYRSSGRAYRYERSSGRRDSFSN